MCIVGPIYLYVFVIIPPNVRECMMQAKHGHSIYIQMVNAYVGQSQVLTVERQHEGYFQTVHSQNCGCVFFIFYLFSFYFANGSFDVDIVKAEQLPQHHQHPFGINQHVLACGTLSLISSVHDSLSCNLLPNRCHRRYVGRSGIVMNKYLRFLCWSGTSGRQWKTVRFQGQQMC